MPGYSCEPSTCNCVYSMFNAQYTNPTTAQQDCWNDPLNCCMQSPPTCETQPTLSCWICLHHPGGQCIDFNTYFTYGSGAPGMVATQAFLMTSVVGPDPSTGVYISHQGGQIFDNEADCVATGCDPADPPPPPVAPPVHPKFDDKIDIGYDIEKDSNVGGIDNAKRRGEKINESNLERLTRKIITQL